MTTHRRGQVRLGPRTWAIIREAYLSGASAASLAEAYGCSLGTIRYRAVREGWRRCDAAEPGRADRDVAAPAPPARALSAAELNELAIVEAGRALAAGRPSEAVAYIRVAEALQRLTAPQAQPPPEPPEMDADELARRTEDLRARSERLNAILAEKYRQRRERESLQEFLKTSSGPSSGDSGEGAERRRAHPRVLIQARRPQCLS